MVPPKKTYADFNFTDIYSDFFLYVGTDFVPIKFEVPTVGKLKNWSIGEVWGPFFSCGNSVFQF